MIDIFPIYHWHIWFCYCLSKGQGGATISKLTWFQISPNFVQGGGLSNLHISKFNIWKNTFGLIDRFSLENLRDFLWNALSLPILYLECSTHDKSAPSDAGRSKFSKVSYQSSLCVEEGGRGCRADVQIVVDPGSLVPRNYLSWQKWLADLRLFIIFRPNVDDFVHFWINFGQFLTNLG